MSRDLNLLDSLVKVKAHRARKLAAQGGVDMFIYCTHRDTIEQAEVFRSTRTTREIQEKIEWYEVNGYGGLAKILDGVGPQSGIVGEHITWAGPGESWHQYLKAFDYAPIVKGKLLWNFKKHEDKWAVCISAIVASGLYSGAAWGDMPHACNNRGNPLKMATFADINSISMQGLIDLGLVSQ